MSANPVLHFDGATFIPERDGKRLTQQWCRVRALMRDQAWRTLSDISESTGDPEASVSARLRDFRKDGDTVNRRYVRRGLFEYQLIVAVRQMDLT